MPRNHYLKQPNILFVVADDHRADCVGGDRISGPATPTLDELSKNGVSMSGARIGGGHNPAVCVPSRASLLTGCPPWQALDAPEAEATEDNIRIQTDRSMLADPFREAGYETFVTGKWHNDRRALNRSFENGSNIFFGGMTDHLDLSLHDYDPTGAYPDENAKTVPGFSTEVFAAAAQSFINSRKDRSRPFFLYMALTSPHDPRTPPEEYRKRYDSSKIELPPNFAREHPFDNGELDIRDERLAANPRDPQAIREHLADYYAMIEHHDYHIGQIIKTLKDTSEFQDTIIIYTSDHGLAIGSHGLLGKQNMYEHSLRVPMTASGPGICKGKIISDDVYSFSIFPTLCELANCPIPESVSSKSFASLLKPQTRSPAPQRPLFSHYRGFQRSVKFNRLKYARYETTEDTTELLFDIDQDPYEINNLANDPRFLGQKEQLSALLEKWWSGIANSVKTV